MLIKGSFKYKTNNWLDNQKWQNNRLIVIKLESYLHQHPPFHKNKSSTMKFFLPICLFVLISIFPAPTSHAQKITGDISKMQNEFKVDENLLMATNWRYVKAALAETGEAIHTADDNYDYFLSLKYDYTYEYYLNGKRDKGTWLLNDESNELYYNFRNIKWWEIVEFSETELILEFKIGTREYNYIFERVEYKDTPFQQAANNLPVVKVNDRKARRRAKKPKKTLKNVSKKEELIPIEIQLAGGGFYGGLNPIVKDFVHIKTSGRYIKEQESLQNGSVKRVDDVEREDLERLVQFIESKGFFDYDRTYDCVAGDCIKRKRKKPTPIPLRLSVRYGDEYNIVIVTIYGRDDRRGDYVQYPKELDMIVAGINKLIGE